MNVDPTMNVVVFKINRKGETDTLMGTGPTKAADCIKTAWLGLQKEHGIKEKEVVEIYSEWEPSPEDAAFIKSKFSKVKRFAYSFKRPPADQWDKALQEVVQIMSQSLSQKAVDTMKAESQNALLLPVLRNSDGISEVMVSRRITPELVITLAKVGMTPRKTIGIDYLMSKTIETQGLDTKSAWEQAFANLTSGLRVNVVQKDSPILILQRDGGMAAAAIGLPDFSKNAAGWVNSEKLLIAIPDPNTLMVCAADSKSTSHLQDTALKSNYGDAVNLTPCLILLQNGQMSVQAKRKTP